MRLNLLSFFVCISFTGFIYAQVSSNGAMDGVSLERAAVYQTKGLPKITGLEWKTEKLFEINYANNSFQNSDGMLEFASLGFSDPILFNGFLYCRLYTAPKNNFITAFDTKNGRNLWTYKSKEQLSNPIVADGIIYFASEDKNIYALDARTGELKWKFYEKKATWNVFSLSPLVADGILYASTGDGKLFAIDTKTQQMKWAFEAKGLLSPIVAAGGNLFFGNEKGNVFSLNQQGKQNWTYKTKGQIRTVVFANESIYFRTDNGELFSLDAKSGQLNWSSKIGGKYQSVFPIASVQIGSALGLYEKTIFFAGSEKSDYYLFAVNSTDGQVSWKLKIDEPTRNPIFADGIIYFGSLGKLYAVDFKDGKLLWVTEYKSSLEGRKVKNVVSTPAIFDGKFYIISDEGVFYAYK